MRAHGRRLTALLGAIGLTAGLAVAAVGPGSNSAEAAGGLPEYQSTFGFPAHAGVYAWGMATATDGTILVGDYWNYRVRRYSTGGALLNTYSSRGNALGQNQAPHGLAVDPNDGSFYVADMNAPRMIDKFAADGTPLLTFSTFVPGVTVPYAYVTRLAVNSQGDIIVISSHNVSFTGTPWQHRVIVYSSTGQYKYHFGTNGTNDGELGLVRGFGIGPNDDIYLADRAKGKVQVFSKTGTFLRAFGAGDFDGDIRGMHVDIAHGLVYVVDADASQIEKYDTAGNHLATFGSEGTGPGQFRDGGREITTAPNGDVYAADFGNTRVNVYAADGTFKFSFPDPPTPPQVGGFNQAQGIAVRGNSKAIYVTDTFNQRIQRFRGDLSYASKFGFRSSTPEYGMNYPRGAAIDPVTEDLLVLNTRQGNIKRYDRYDKYVSHFGSWGADNGEFNLPRGITVGPDRTIYIGDSNNRRVQVFTADGVFVRAMPCGVGPPPGSLSVLMGCTGLAVDDDNNLYAAAITEHRIYKFAPDGTLLAKFGTTGTDPGQLNDPYGVAIYQDHLYVTESGNNRISVFDLDGNFVGAAGSKGSGPGQLSMPRSIDIDTDGTAYVIDGKNERVSVWQIS